MFRHGLSLLLALLFCSANRIEIYEDWQPDAVGEAGISSEIRSALETAGYSVRRWDRSAHRPYLLNWKSVKTFADFKHWLGLGLSRKTALEEETKYLILSNIGVHLKELDLGKIPREKLILFAWEPPTVQPECWDPKFQKHFHKIYTWHDGLVDNVRFFKFHLPHHFSKCGSPIPFEERKFLTLIASRLSSKHPHQLYSEREKLIRFFEGRPEGEFDLYGRYWEKRKYRSWKGAIPDKMAALKQYKFAIAYENSIEPGYITEKLWDSFSAGVVPIYWGAPNIEEYVPADCFIDRRKFESDEALIEHLQSLSKKDWEGYVQRAGAFIESGRAGKFSAEHYVKTLADAVSSATGP